MKILLVNNFYQQPGGEEACFNAERKLLQEHGHEIITFTRHNDEIKGLSKIQRSKTAVQTLWATKSYHDISTVLKHHKPDIAHFTNTFPLISPAAYYACHRARIPVVQSLHNYRLFCPSATFFREGLPCEDCLTRKIPWPGVWHRCYHESHGQSLVVTSMLTLHNLLRTWDTQVDIYIATSEFSRQKFIQGGLLPEKIQIKPNFLEKPILSFNGPKSDFGLFIGRMVPEKGTITVVNAWPDACFPLKIVGDGELLPQLRKIEEKRGNIHILGWQPYEQLLGLMNQARFLVMPSEWYEALPMTLIMAFATGLPVIASRLGALAESVDEGKTGLLFTAGNVADLQQKINWATEHPKEMAQMGLNARMEFEKKYTAEKNYELLMDIYHQARARFQLSKSS